MKHNQGGEPPKVLTIAGSDSGGAAGLQADLKSFAALGVYGMSVVTAVTAQNSLDVTAVHWIPVEHVLAQLDAVLSDYGAAAIKTGFIGRVEIIQALARYFSERRPAQLVVDPVLVNHRGQAMFSQDVTRAYLRELFPLANLVTPNIDEAKLLTGHPAGSHPHIESVARKIQKAGPPNVLITGEKVGDEMIDHLLIGEECIPLHDPRIVTENTRGSGDALTAAICARLAQGEDMGLAIDFARRFTRMGIWRGSRWRLGHGHGPLDFTP